MSNLEIFTGPINTSGSPSGVYAELVGTFQPPAFRVACRSPNGFLGVLPMAFGRKRDAEMAKAALEQAGLATRAALVAAGRARFEQVMIEALQW